MHPEPRHVMAEQRTGHEPGRPADPRQPGTGQAPRKVGVYERPTGLARIPVSFIWIAVVLVLVLLAIYLF